MMSLKQLERVEVDPAIAEQAEAAVWFWDKRNPPLCFIIRCRLWESGWCTGAESHAVVFDDGNPGRENVAFTTISGMEELVSLQQAYATSCEGKGFTFAQMGTLNQDNGDVVDAEWHNLDNVAGLLGE